MRKKTFNPSGKIDTCLYCGERLPLPNALSSPRPEGRHGVEGDSFFCDKRCAYDFAISVVRTGHRLTPNKKKQGVAPPSERRKFRHRSTVVIEAYQLPLDAEPLVIRTLNGDMTARPGDWIINGAKGEEYPCKPDVFAELYEEEA